VRQPQVELLPGAPVRIAREQGVTEHQALERLGLALEGIAEVPVVDHPPAPVDGRAGAAGERVLAGIKKCVILVEGRGFDIAGVG